jgi:hypothetical protein
MATDHHYWERRYRELQQREQAEAKELMEIGELLWLARRETAS